MTLLKIGGSTRTPRSLPASEAPPQLFFGLSEPALPGQGDRKFRAGFWSQSLSGGAPTTSLHLFKCSRPSIQSVKSTPEKSLRGSLFCVLSQESRHIEYFLGLRKWGFGWAGKKFRLKHLMVFSAPSTRPFLEDLGFYFSGVSIFTICVQDRAKLRPILPKHF